jgi:hypothetical protein
MKCNTSTSSLLVGMLIVACALNVCAASFITAEPNLTYA